MKTRRIKILSAIMFSVLLLVFMMPLSVAAAYGQTDAVTAPTYNSKGDSDNPVEYEIAVNNGTANYEKALPGLSLVSLLTKKKNKK